MDLKSLIKRRASHKSKLTQFKAYLDALLSCCTSLSSIQVNELNIRLSKLEELYSDYDQVQFEIENLSETPGEQYTEREAFEAKYYSAIAVGRDTLEKNAAACHVAAGAPIGSSASSVTGSGAPLTGTHFKLPIIHLPNFSGRYQDWLEFHDTYTSLIHENNAIPNISKFHYLRAALKDSAACIIQSLDFSANNYEVAWQLLCERYNNNRLLVNNHIQSIFNLESIHKESAKSIRNIIDTVNRNLRALKTLKLPTEHWDVLIIHIVSSKLDPVTSREWEIHRNLIKDMPTLNDFNNFLKGRADLLETVDESIHTKRRHSDSTIIRNKTFITHSSGTLQGSKGTLSCPICKHKHAIYQCFKFKSLPIEKRIEQVKSLKLCLNCLRKHGGTACKSGPCTICSERHNTLLHQQTDTCVTKSSSVVLPSSHSDEIQCKHTYTEKQNISLSSTNKPFIHDNIVLLSTAVINTFSHEGNTQTVRVLLDNGSTSNFITESLCKRLNLKTYSTRTAVEGLNHQSCQITERCDVTISSRYDHTYTSNISCLIVPHITQSLPTVQVNYLTLNIPTTIQLADPTFHSPSEVEMLLGADIFWDILGKKRITLGKTKPTLNETRLGWLVSGAINSQYIKQNTNTVHCHHIQDTELQRQLIQFFELETITPTISNMSKEQTICEESFTNNTTRQADGRFIVTIPLQKSPQCLGDSYEQAVSRFLSLERKFKREPTFKRLYCEFMHEYINLGHMSENKQFTHAHVASNTHTHTNTSGVNNKPCSTIQNFLPHHGVLRDNSLTTQLRVVFDASALTTSGLSFNNIQLVGPSVQSDLISILIRFRQHKYVVTADIEKMYRQVLVNESQRQLQQIVWRFEPTHELKRYTLNTVTYGTASAPYLATRCIVELGKQCDDPLIREVIINDMYVDDYLSGNDNITNLIEICRGVIRELKNGQFNLRKWYSNDSYILEQLHGKHTDNMLLNLNKNKQAKTLGLLWACNTDHFVYSLESIKIDKNIFCKRTILSVIAQIFDPLGLINPCILTAKLILQQLWALNSSWDETIPPGMVNQWSKFINSLSQLNNIKIPRHVVCDQPTQLEIHAFSDSSTHAYSACVYLRSISAHNMMVHLVMAKSRVAPLKPVTIPRLELCGALLATRLAKKVKESLRLTIKSTTYWCDSTIVLGWIKSSNTHLLKPFVLNRISEIIECTEPESWRYVPTNMNPADIGSRGLEPAKLQNCSLWWHGPDFLQMTQSHWPQSLIQMHDHDLPEIKIQTNKNYCHSLLQQQNAQINSTYTQQLDTSIIHKYSNIIKLNHIIAYVCRFINNCRYPHKKRTSHLQISELRTSMHFICKLSQSESFRTEYHTLCTHGNLSTKNKLVKLNPFFQEETGLIRVGGRLSNSNYTYDTKFPILLHGSNYVTQLIFQHYHITLLHAGPQLLLSNIRHKYWIINGRNLARKITHNCITCLRFSGKHIQPIMGNLPKERVAGGFPFLNTAIDYAGPVLIADRKGRGSKHIKAYICVFVCLAVKAVHIELVTDLTKEGFLAALNRFIARRGRPVNVFSDNGTNFIGACNDLAKFLKHTNYEITSYASQNSINFKFSPAYSPHFNGLAESAVKSIKHHLKRVLSLAYLTYEEMNTLLVQIEAILNSRPITPLSSDPSDLIPLTPSHFLIGRMMTLLPSPQVQDCSLHILPRYQRIQQLKAHFWNRYYKEYISELQTRVKWHKSNGELRHGEMVLIKDDRLPPNRWMIGRVTNLYPGTDGVARVADVRTSTGTIRRAFNRLCPLPLLEQDVPKGGTC